MKQQHHTIQCFCKDSNLKPYFKDENIVSVVLKEEPGDRFDPDYMEDICSGTFEKVFLPIEHNEVDFSNEMVNFNIISTEFLSFSNKNYLIEPKAFVLGKTGIGWRI